MRVKLRKIWNNSWLVKRKRQATLAKIRAERAPKQEEFKIAKQTQKELKLKRTRGLFSGIEINQRMNLTLFDGRIVNGIFLGLTKTQQKALIKNNGQTIEFPVGAIDLIQTSKTKRRAKNARERLSSLLEPKHRKELGRLIRDTRRVNKFIDLKGGFRRKITPAKNSEFMGVRLDHLIKEMLLRKNTVKAIDLGCGNSTILKRLKEQFQDKIETHGLDPTLPNKDLFDKVHVGILEQYGFNEKYDLIISNVGALTYAISPAFALQKVCNTLSKGGIAIVTINDYKIDEAITRIRESGFEITKTPYGLSISNPNGNTVDLRGLANQQLYTNRHKFNPKTEKFKTWKEKIIIRPQTYKEE
jgi:hypothetical protein